MDWTGPTSCDDDDDDDDDDNAIVVPTTTCPIAFPSSKGHWRDVTIMV